MSLQSGPHGRKLCGAALIGKWRSEKTMNHVKREMGGSSSGGG
jgi:hypothetical protein